MAINTIGQRGAMATKASAKLNLIPIMIKAPIVVTVSAVSRPVTAIMAHIFVKPHFWINFWNLLSKTAIHVQVTFQESRVCNSVFPGCPGLFLVYRLFCFFYLSRAVSCLVSSVETLAIVTLAIVTLAVFTLAVVSIMKTHSS